MKIRLHLKIFIFVIIFFITKQIKFYGMLMLFALIHEIGHMIAGIALGFKPDTLEIMPVGLSISFKAKIDNYNKKIGKATLLTLKKIIISIAGPVTNIVLAIVFYYISIRDKNIYIYSNILIATFNMLPVYPLDGGRMVKGIMSIFFGRRKAEIIVNRIANIIVIFLTVVSSITILYYNNIAILIILAYLWYLLIIENKKIRRKEQIYEKIKINE